MTMRCCSFLFMLCMMYVPRLTNAQELIIQSKALAKPITVKVYNPVPQKDHEQIIYITDGQKALDYGTWDNLELLVKKKKIKPAIYVFVSTVVNGEDLRNEFFFCNPRYLKFFEEELIPQVEQQIGQSYQPEDRALIGISFGGLNGAYFAARSTAFKSYGLLSPVTYPRQQEIIQKIANSENKDLTIFISSGTNDAEAYTGPLIRLFKRKDYFVKQHFTLGGHDFKNWNGQLKLMMNWLIK